MSLDIILEHFGVVDYIHILQNVHLLLGCGYTTFVVIIERIGHREGRILVLVKVLQFG